MIPLKPKETELTNPCNTSGCLVVCGYEASSRILQSVVPHLDFKLEIVEVETKEELLAALAARRPPLCVLDFKVPIGATTKDAAALMLEGYPQDIAHKMSGMVMKAVPAHDIIEEAVAASPETQYIVACHNKGYDVVKAHKADYMKHSAVIKTMGFINGLVNMRYLARLLTRVYAGRTWKPTF